MSKQLVFVEGVGTCLQLDAVEAEWKAWSDGLWDSMERRFGYPGLAHLEQRMLRSKRERRCVECGATGFQRQLGGRLIPSVDHYWFCAECAEYWTAKEVESES